MSNDTAMVIVTAAYNVNFMVEVRATAREVITDVDEGVKEGKIMVGGRECRNN